LCLRSSLFSQLISNLIDLPSSPAAGAKVSAYTLAKIDNSRSGLAMKSDLRAVRGVVNIL
jgi:hypothetical protein